MIKKLIALADRLDKKGLKKEADLVDDLIQKFSEFEEQDEDDFDCGFDVDECHYCYAYSGEDSWLCASCREMAKRIGIGEKQYAYTDPEQIRAFEARELGRASRGGPMIVEDLTDVPEDEVEKIPPEQAN